MKQGTTMIRLFRLFTIIFTIVLTCGTLHAQALPTKVISASTPNPVGSGARAVGMGGAFIAVADDATAASWNPAGLTQLKKPEFSFALSYFSRRDDFSSANHPETEGVQKISSEDLNYFSVAYPFQLLDRNMIVSLNYQILYEFDRDINTDINSSFVPPSFQSRRKVDFRQSGKLRTLSPAYAIEITPDFSVGATFNIWTDNLFWSNGWESDTTINGSYYRGGIFKGKGNLVRTEKIKDEDRYYGFSGFNMHLGFLWNATRFLTLGGVVKTPFTADIQHERVVTNRWREPGSLQPPSRLRVDENVDLDMPLSYGLGAAFRLSDRLTLSLDVYRTEWDHFRLEDGQGNRLSPITLKPSYKSPTEETTQVRMGGEYLFIFTKTVVPVRAGVFYDPEPSEKNPQDFWGVALGTGVSIGELIFDCAYQFRYGKDASGDVFLDLPGTSADVEQHLFMVSMIYHF
jgi:long-subunit fatty acid transport protein